MKHSVNVRRRSTVLARLPARHIPKLPFSFSTHPGVARHAGLPIEDRHASRRLAQGQPPFPPVRFHIFTEGWNNILPAFFSNNEMAAKATASPSWVSPRRSSPRRASCWWRTRSSRTCLRGRTKPDHGGHESPGPLSILAIVYAELAIWRSRICSGEEGCLKKDRGPGQ